MLKKIIEQPEIKLIGLKISTSFQNELKSDSSKIGPLVAQYWQENIAEKIPNRKNPGITLVGYSNYKPDEYGEYDYLIGEEVTSLDNIPNSLSSLVVHAGKYLRFTSNPGKKPQIIFETWQQIWELTKTKKLEGQRAYITDFEVYDQRAEDPEHTVFDIYLGIK